MYQLRMIEKSFHTTVIEHSNNQWKQCIVKTHGWESYCVSQWNNWVCAHTWMELREFFVVQYVACSDHMRVNIKLYTDILRASIYVIK